jgi:hypothetical protein
MLNPLYLLFRQGNQTIFLPQVLLKIGKLEFIVPCDISIRLRKKIVITEIYGADFSVKEDFGLCDFDIMIDGQIGNTDSSTGAKIMGINKNVDALDFLKKLYALYKEKAPLEIKDVNEEFARNFIGQVAKKIDQAFDLPFGGPAEPEGILAYLEITRVVLSSLDIRPVPGGHYHFTIEAISESPEPDVFEIDQPNFFLSEERYNV